MSKFSRKITHIKNNNKLISKINNNTFFKNILFFTIFLLLLDLITKYIFTNKYFFENSFINIQFSKNFGSAFSMFSNYSYYNYIIILLSFIILYFLFINLKEFKQNKLSRYSFYFLIPGILGNLYDRIFFGYVRDFIGLKYLFIFNIADVYLTLSVILYLSLELNLFRFISYK